MSIRPTMASNYELVRSGLAQNMARLVRAQEQAATGRRILRPSDDPAGSATALGLRRQLGEIGRWRAGLDTARPVLSTATSAVQSGGEALSEARELVIQGLNGTLNASDRTSVGNEIEMIKQRLLEIANSRFGERQLFGGTAANGAPYAAAGSGAYARTVYRGDDQAYAVQSGFGARLTVGSPGSSLFSSSRPTGTSYAGLTGAARGATADQGTGFERLHVRHDGTGGTPGAGVQLVNGGAGDTFLGTRDLVIDSAAGTVRFGAGPERPIPAAGAAGASDYALTDEHGATLRLDFSAWDGTGSSATLSGAGSISLDGATFTTLDFSAADLQLRNEASGAILHVDTRGIVRSGVDLVTFSGTANVFDVLQGIADDLRNVDGLDAAALQQRMSARLAEFDRNRDALQQGLGTLGSRSEQLEATATRLEGLDLHATGLLSDVEDADLTSVILDMTRAEQTLQLAQATGVRLLQNTLLDYLR